MSELELIDATPEQPSLNKSSLLKFAGFVALIMIFNLIMTLFIPIAPNSITHLDGKVATADDVKNAIKLSILFTIPILGFLLSAFLALIPYKKKRYLTKLLQLALFIILCLNLIVSLFAMLKIFY